MNAVPRRAVVCHVVLWLLLQVRDAGNLLTRAGLALPTVDVDTLQLSYADPMEAVAHLRVGGSGWAGGSGAGGIASTYVWCFADLDPCWLVILVAC